MIELVPYRPEHLARIELQPRQRALRAHVLREGYAAQLAIPGASWTAVDGKRVVGCGGLQPQWDGRALAWALIGRLPRAQWPRLFRLMRARIDAAFANGTRRIEADVRADFGQGCRLAHLLGFEVEALRRKYAPDGSDHFLYARVA